MIELPLQPRLTWPDRRIDAVRGTVAVERGPLVFCLESVDLPSGVDIEDVHVPAEVAPVADGPAVRVAGRIIRGESAPVMPYAAQSSPVRVTELDVRLVPYHSWAQRGPTRMRVFLPFDR